MTDLATVQRRIAALVRAPEGVRAQLALEGGAALEELESLVRGDRRASAVERLEIYAHAWFHRILEVLRRDYPALAALLGEEGFHDLAALYLIAHPSRHPSLRHAGAALAGFLAEEALGEPFRRRWPFAADLARLEWALVDAFDAPDVPILTREDLAALAPEDFADLELRAAPGVARLEASWRVSAAREAVDRGDPPAPPERGEETLLVHRLGEIPRYRAVCSDEAEALRSLLAGTRFDAFCLRVAAGCGEAQAPARAARLLDWMVGSELVARPA